MSTSISGINQVASNQGTVNINNDEGVKQNTKSKPSIPNKFFQYKNLSNTQTTKQHNIQKTLADTYGLTKTDAQNIESAVNALQDAINPEKRERVEVENLKFNKDFQGNIDSSADIKNGFFTKLKLALAKVAHFFGSDSKLEKLQSEGLQKFNGIKKLLTEESQGRDFLASFIEKHADNKSVMDGLYKILGGKNFEKNPYLDSFISQYGNNRTVMDGLCKILGTKTEHLDFTQSKDNYGLDLRATGETEEKYFNAWKDCFNINEFVSLENDFIFDENKIKTQIKHSQLYLDVNRAESFTIDYQTSYGNIKGEFNCKNLENFVDRYVAVLKQACSKNDTPTILALGSILARVIAQGYNTVVGTNSETFPDQFIIANGHQHMTITGSPYEPLNVNIKIQGTTPAQANSKGESLWQHSDVEFEMRYPFDTETFSYNSDNNVTQTVKKANIDIYGIVQNKS